MSAWSEDRGFFPISIPLSEGTPGAELVLEARRRASKFRQRRPMRGSFTNGRGMLVGLIGQIVVRSTFGWEEIDAIEYDLRDRDALVEVKSKTTTVEPLPHHHASVAASSFHQQATNLVFCRVQVAYNPDPKKPIAPQKLWILGWLSREEFFDRSALVRKGEMDGNYAARVDCRSVQAVELRRLVKP